MMQSIEKNEGWQPKKSSMTWIVRKFWKQSRMKISQKEEGLLSTNGSLKSKETEFLEPDW
jgi:hypothetical protein